MAVTEEEGGRLNAFAKEPKIEILDKEVSNGNGSQLFFIVAILLLMVLIAFSLTIS